MNAQGRINEMKMAKNKPGKRMSIYIKDHELLADAKRAAKLYRLPFSVFVVVCLSHFLECKNENRTKR